MDDKADLHDNASTVVAVTTDLESYCFLGRENKDQDAAKTRQIPPINNHEKLQDNETTNSDVAKQLDTTRDVSSSDYDNADTDFERFLDELEFPLIRTGSQSLLESMAKELNLVFHHDHFGKASGICEVKCCASCFVSGRSVCSVSIVRKRDAV